MITAVPDPTFIKIQSQGNSIIYKSSVASVYAVDGIMHMESAATDCSLNETL